MCMWFWRASCGVCVSQLIGLARASWALGDFGCHSGPLLPGFLGRAVVVLGFMESFSKFYRWHSTLVEKYKVSLKILLQRGKSEPEFCGDMEVCGFGGIMGWGGVGWGGGVGSGFSEQFGRLVGCYGRIGCGLDVVRWAVFLVVSLVIVGGCALVFGCTTAIWASSSGAASLWNFNQWVGAWLCTFGLARHGSTVGFHLLWHTVVLAVGLSFVCRSVVWFLFSLWCIGWVGSPCVGQVFVFFCIKSGIRARGGVCWL